MAAYTKFVSVAVDKFVQVPGCYPSDKKKRPFPHMRRLVFDVLRKRIEALIDWVKKAKEQEKANAAKLEAEQLAKSEFERKKADLPNAWPYPPKHIGWAKRTACGMMLAIGQMFDLEWPLVVKPSSEGRNFVYNDVGPLLEVEPSSEGRNLVYNNVGPLLEIEPSSDGRNFFYDDVGPLLELFSNSRAPASAYAQDYHTGFDKPKGTESPGGLVLVETDGLSS